MGLKNTRIHLKHKRSCLPPCPINQATRFIPVPNPTHYISVPKSFPQEIQKMCPEALVSRAVTFKALPCGHMVCKVYKTRAKPPLVKTPASLHSDSTSLPLFLMLALEWAGWSWVGKSFGWGLVGRTCIFGFQLFPFVEELLLGTAKASRDTFTSHSADLTARQRLEGTKPEVTYDVRVSYSTWNQKSVGSPREARFEMHRNSEVPWKLVSGKFSQILQIINKT